MDNPADKHKQNISNIFNNAAGIYGTIGPDFFDYFGKRLVDHVNIQLGNSVLDIACGRGSSMFYAHEKIGNDGHITGIDISPEMINLTGNEIILRGLQNIEVLQMDAEELKFNDESFDAVISGFSLFFLPDLEKCLGEIKRVLKKDGVFVTSTWGDRDARWKPLLDLMASFQQKVNPVSSIKTRALNSETELKEQFLKAGFNKIEISLETKEFYYNNEEEWLKSLWSHGRRGMMEKMSDSDLEYFKKEAFNFLSTIKNDSEIPELFCVFITKVFKD